MTTSDENALSKYKSGQLTFELTNATDTVNR